MPFVERARIDLPGGAAPRFDHADIHLAHREGFCSFEVADGPLRAVPE